LISSLGTAAEVKWRRRAGGVCGAGAVYPPKY